MANLRTLLTLIWVISGKLCQIARPLLSNNCAFSGSYTICPEKWQLVLIQKWPTSDHLLYDTCAGSIGRALLITVKQNVRVEGRLHPEKLHAGGAGGYGGRLASCSTLVVGSVLLAWCAVGRTLNRL